MEIIDNFLPHDEFKKLHSLITGDLPWYLRDKVTEEIESPVDGFPSEPQHKHLCHVFLNHLAKSIYLGELDGLFTKIGVRELYRAKANLTLNNGRSVVGGWHYDNEGEEDMKIAVLYLNDNNGYTLLEDGTKVFSKDNRLVTFENNILHTAVSQTDTDERFVLNINFK